MPTCWIVNSRSGLHLYSGGHCWLCKEKNPLDSSQHQHNIPDPMWVAFMWNHPGNVTAESVSISAGWSPAKQSHDGGTSRRPADWDQTALDWTGKVGGRAQHFLRGKGTNISGICCLHLLQYLKIQKHRISCISSTFHTNVQLNVAFQQKWLKEIETSETKNTFKQNPLTINKIKIRSE